MMLRSIYIVFTLWAISFILFAVTQLLPGDPAQLILGEFATEENLKALRAKLGLNRPWYVQYFDWLSGIARGDLGQSYSMGTSINELVWRRAWLSVQLAGFTFFFVLLLAIPLGTAAAVKRETIVDTVISSTGYVALSVPTFVLALFLVVLFGGPVFSIFPNHGYASLTEEGIVEWARHLILPSLSLLFVVTAHVMRQTRSSMIEAMQAEYVRTARLKGLPKYKVIVKHALRNGLLPTITVLALNFGFLIGGIVVIEEIFAYPGLGRLLLLALSDRDIPLIQATVLIIAAAYTFANFGADLLYAYLDPRIKYGGGGE